MHPELKMALASFLIGLALLGGLFVVEHFYLHELDAIELTGPLVNPNHIAHPAAANIFDEMRHVAWDNSNF